MIVCLNKECEWVCVILTHASNWTFTKEVKFKTQTLLFQTKSLCTTRELVSASLKVTLQGEHEVIIEEINPQSIAEDASARQWGTTPREKVNQQHEEPHVHCVNSWSSTPGKVQLWLRLLNRFRITRRRLYETLTSCEDLLSKCHSEWKHKQVHPLPLFHVCNALDVASGHTQWILGSM